MARVKLKVTYSDGRVVESIVSPKAEVDFERHFGTSVIKAGRDMHQQYYYYLAWAGLHHAGREAADFDTFLGQIDEVVDAEAQEESGEEPGPTKAARRPETSSS
ncbi:hypothetical protein [Amycolatopsis lurida]|uniref:hypothetical protein n=1 Tax=Amycolatopsis lurida TaxID=31959 RepID=UPI003648205B